MAIEWIPERCETCGTPMPDRLWLLTECRRLPDGAIGIVSPGAAKTCSLACLMTWAFTQQSIRQGAIS
jgi:hypothetical protein